MDGAGGENGGGITYPPVTWTGGPPGSLNRSKSTPVSGSARPASTISSGSASGNKRQSTGEDTANQIAQMWDDLEAAQWAHPDLKAEVMRRKESLSARRQSQARMSRLPEEPVVAHLGRFASLDSRSAKSIKNSNDNLENKDEE